MWGRSQLGGCWLAHRSWACPPAPVQCTMLQPASQAASLLHRALLLPPALALACRPGALCRLPGLQHHPRPARIAPAAADARHTQLLLAAAHRRRRLLAPPVPSLASPCSRAARRGVTCCCPSRTTARCGLQMGWGASEGQPCRWGLPPAGDSALHMRRLQRAPCASKLTLLHSVCPNCAAKMGGGQGV